MKPQYYLAIAVRLFAIFLFLYSMQQSRMLLELLINGYVNDVALPIWFGIVVSLLPLAVSLVLWFFPLTVSQLILTEEINQPFEPINIQPLLTVLIIAIGLFFIYYAISDSIYWATILKMSSMGAVNGTKISPPDETNAYVLSTIIELVMALLFIFKANTLAFHLLKVAK